MVKAEMQEELKETVISLKVNFHKIHFAKTSEELNTDNEWKINFSSFME